MNRSAFGRLISVVLAFSLGMVVGRIPGVPGDPVREAQIYEYTQSALFAEKAIVLSLGNKTPEVTSELVGLLDAQIFNLHRELKRSSTKDSVAEARFSHLLTFRKSLNRSSWNETVNTLINQK